MTSTEDPFPDALPPPAPAAAEAPAMPETPAAVAAPAAAALPAAPEDTPPPAPGLPALDTGDEAVAATHGAATPVDETAAATPVPPDLSPAATGARLAALFPALFVGPDGRGQWKAIKLRIHADIQARAPGEFSKHTLGIFFSRYTTTTAYLKALAAPGAQRCDLDGQPAGEIAEEHRSAAAEEVARRQAIVAERRAAQRKAQAPQRPPAQDGGETPAATMRPPRAPRPPHDDATTPRPERAARPEGPARERPPRREQPAQQHERRPQERRDGSSRGSFAARPARGAPRHDPQPAPARDAAPATLPQDPAQRERALLLRAFDASPLSKANFCALKRMTEAELDAQLAQARAERGGR